MVIYKAVRFLYFSYFAVEILPILCTLIEAIKTDRRFERNVDRIGNQNLYCRIRPASEPIQFPIIDPGSIASSVTENLDY